jgi:hypothetical protein
MNMPTQLTHLTCASDDRLRVIEEAVREYHAALDRREHGAVACHNAMAKIERAFGVYWRSPE